MRRGFKGKKIRWKETTGLGGFLADGPRRCEHRLAVVEEAEDLPYRPDHRRASEIRCPVNPCFENTVTTVTLPRVKIRENSE